MRIVGGRFRGKHLTPVGQGDESAHLRPTTDRVRESLFNVLAHNKWEFQIDGARVLDLFAGTGALGLEALSRGASFVLFVENGNTARALIRQNIDVLKAIGPTKLFRRDATNMGAAKGVPFDLVFLDPPYGTGLGEKALRSAADGKWLSDGALIIWEDNADQIAPAGFTHLDARRYGETSITILRYDG
ncbi:MAG: 16S rRNA (guanine(966)-N(2))-methyltransferase RsmD [Pseudomonadota bacterium]